MSHKDTSLTGHERKFGDNELIVSKTDLRGRITYANDVFIGISGFTEVELIGQPHALVRHSGMPRCVFKMLWDQIQEGREIFAYVVNRAKNGDHYWVYAHVTPTVEPGGDLIGYHSNRRNPRRDAIQKIEPLYRELVTIEQRVANSREGLKTSTDHLHSILKTRGTSYDRFVSSL